MSRFTADSRDRVRDAVDMIAVVSDHTELRRAGASEYVGRCPFHDERTPSFGVNPIEKVYYCFGCQASGDVFTFVMETEGLDFPGALQTLADRFGVELETEEEDPGAAARRQRRERLQSLLGRASAYYARYLWEAREASGAREYLLGRGLREETLKEFRVGYAPSPWDRILTASRRAGFSDEELLTVGLAQRSQNRPGQIYDRFRERIMFPSTDARGNVIGFGARAMRDNQRPKYLNTAEGELYHKRRVLFGLDRARAAAARAGTVILVEGYTDVLALHQAGLGNAVGIMGTALTEEQIAELERLAKVLLLCLDSDRAGQDAMLRAAQLTDRRKLELRVVPLPDGTDPADLIEREGGDALRERVQASVPFVAFHVDRILERHDTRSAEGRDRAFGELQPALGGPAEERVRPGAAATRRGQARALGGATGDTDRDVYSAGCRGERRRRERRRRRSAPSRSTNPLAPSGRSWRCASPCRKRAPGCCSRSIPTSSSPASSCAGRRDTSPGALVRRSSDLPGGRRTARPGRRRPRRPRRARRSGQRGSPRACAPVARARPARPCDST